MYAEDVLLVTNAPCQLLTLGQMNAGTNKAAVLSIGIENDGMLVVRKGGKKFLSAAMPSLKACNEWTHVALAFDASGTKLVINGGDKVATTNETLGAELGVFLDGNILGYDDHAPDYDLYDLAIEKGGGLDEIEYYTLYLEDRGWFPNPKYYDYRDDYYEYSDEEHKEHVEAVIEWYKGQVLKELRSTYGEDVPCNLGADSGRQIAEVQFRSKALTVDEIKSVRYEVLTGDEG